MFFPRVLMLFSSVFLEVSCEVCKKGIEKDSFGSVHLLKHNLTVQVVG